jgi:thymidylate kinase
MAGLLGRGEAMCCKRDGVKGLTCKPLTLSEKEAHALTAQDQTLWILPLLADKDLIPQLETALERIAVAPASFRAAGLIPCFATEGPAPFGTEGNTEGVETRLLPSWWGLLPGDAYPSRVRSLFQELFRFLCPDKMFRFLVFENYALAGIDLYAESLMDRFGTMDRMGKRGEPADALQGEKKIPRPLIFGICGTDGSGKSSHVAALRDHLESMGLRVKVHKIYRHGVFHDAVTDLTRQCTRGKNLHLWRLQRIIKAFDSVKYFYSTLVQDFETTDAVIFDRYVYTHYAAGVGRYHHDPFAREILSVFPPANRIYLLDVPTEEALHRIGFREEKTVDENPYMLSRYRHALLDLGDRYGFKVLDARDPFEKNRRIILEDATRIIGERERGR